MPESLPEIDLTLFRLINERMANRLFDIIMPWLRNPMFWIPVYILIILFCLAKFKKQGLFILVFLVAAIGLADFSSATLIKPAVHRARPCREPLLAGDIDLRIDCGTGYSFPSTHATDHFALSVFLIAVFYRRWKWVWLWCLLWAALVSFAQVYVGLHYPFDVLGGAVYGATIGCIFGILHKKFDPKFYRT